MHCNICNSEDKKHPTGCPGCLSKTSNVCPKCNKECKFRCDKNREIREEVREKTPKKWDKVKKEWIPEQEIFTRGNLLDTIESCGAEWWTSPCSCGEELFNHCPDCGHFDAKNARFKCTNCGWQLATCPGCVTKAGGINAAFNKRWQVVQIAYEDKKEIVICEACGARDSIKSIL